MLASESHAAGGSTVLVSKVEAPKLQFFKGDCSAREIDNFLWGLTNTLVWWE